MRTEKNLAASASGLLARRFYPVAVVVVTALAVSLLTRLVLLLTQSGWHEATPGQILAALAVGEVFDLVAALWLALGLTVYLTLLPERFWRSRFHHRFLLLNLAVFFFAMLFVGVIEFYFFAEFNGRFNFVAVDYLMFPTEVGENIWQSYPTGKVILVLAAVSAGLIFALRGRLHRAWQAEATPARHRWSFAAGHVALLTGVTALVSPDWSQVSADRPLNELAENGYYAFTNALLGRDAPYEGLYATREATAEQARLPALLAEPALDPASPLPQLPLRHIRASGPERRLNVVVVLEESLGSEFIGALHPRATSLSPEFDALTAQGTLLTHAYSTGNRTIRAIEATTASLPPLPGISIVRRAQSKDLFTLPALLRDRGYQTMFVYGGRALFDGMGGYLGANGVDRIVDQGDFPSGTFTTAWGAADEAIFTKAIAEMDALEATGKPFYTLILSVSNHRPYLFPQDHLQPLPGLKRRENVVRYADYALGRFVREAKEHAFFDHTLFVLMGDHGARVYGAAEIPLASYEVPVLFLAPGIVAAGARLDTLASSLDIPPTVLGILGFDYDSKFYGHDLFQIPPEAGRALMTHNNDIALLRGSTIAVLGLHESAEVYRVSPDESFTPVERPEASDQALIEDAIAYYHSADTLYRSGRGSFVSSAPRLARGAKPPG